MSKIADNIRKRVDKNRDKLLYMGIDIASYPTIPSGERAKAPSRRRKPKVSPKGNQTTPNAPQAIVEPRVSTDPHYGRRGPHGHARYWSSED